MLWHIELKFCIWLCFTVLQIEFECSHFFGGVMPLLELRILEIQSIPHFSLTCFDILSWNFAYEFFVTVLQMKFECRQFTSFFVGLMPLLGLRILKIHSFRTFLLHALTYWAEILHLRMKYHIFLLNDHEFTLNWLVSGSSRHYYLELYCQLLLLSAIALTSQNNKNVKRQTHCKNDRLEKLSIVFKSKTVFCNGDVQQFWLANP